MRPECLSVLASMLIECACIRMLTNLIECACIRMLAGAAKQNEDLDFLRLFQRSCEGDDPSYKIEIVSATPARHVYAHSDRCAAGTLYANPHC